jgi:hypothetical protein
MPLETFIARWVAVIWLAFGLSHALYPNRWAALIFPLKERETGGFLIASFNFPLGLIIILGHNVWVWDVPVIITIAGWLTTLKSATYLFYPRGHMLVIPSERRLKRGLRTLGVVMIILGGIVGYDAFLRR